MTLTPVASSNIATIGYDAKLSELGVLFTNGGMYRYVGVPPEVFAALEKADSKGAYLAANIKGKFTFFPAKFPEKAQFIQPANTR